MALSIVLGAVIALLHGVAGLLLYRRALRLPASRSIKIALGGTVLRLAAALVLVVLVIKFMSVHVTAFIVALFVVFVFMLVADVALMHRLA